MDITHPDFYYKHSDDEGVCQYKERYQFAGEYCKEKKVLDMCCGYGHGVDIIAGFKPKKTVAIDNDKRKLKYASGKYGNRVQFINTDVHNEVPCFYNHFDIIIMSDVIEYVKYPKKAMATAFLYLKPKGKIIIFTDGDSRNNDDCKHNWCKKGVTNFLRELGLTCERNVVQESSGHLFFVCKKLNS